MLDEAPGVRFVLAALRVLVGTGLAVLAVGLLVDVRIEEVDVSCGFAPVAAIAHDEPACRVDGRNQTLGAVASGAVCTWLLSAGLRSRRDRRRRGGFPGIGGPATGLDTDAVDVLRLRRRRGWLLAVVASIGIVGSTVVAVDADAEAPLGENERNAVVTALAGPSEVHVAFSAGGTRREATVWIPDRQLTVGDGVRIRVAESGSAIAVPPDEGPTWPVVVWLAFVVLLAISALLLWRVRQTWQILEKHPWRRLEPSIDQPAGSPAAWIDDGLPTMFETTSPRRVPIRNWRGEPVDVAGDRDGLVVLRIPGDTSMQLARQHRG